MKLMTLRLVILAGLSFHAVPAAAETLVVNVAGIATDSGQLLLSLCSREAFLSDAGCGMGRRVEARPGEVGIILDQVPPGRYAVQVFHDENADGRLGRQFLGIPTEGYGFSNNPSTLLGPPTFDQAAVTVGADTSIRIELFYRTF